MDNDLTNRKSKLSAAKQALLAKRLRGVDLRESAGQKIAPRQPADFAPPSFAQQRLWLLDQLEPGGAAYNISAAFRFAGSLNYDALRQSLNAAVARHETLRTGFKVRDVG